ncbi:MAG: DUF5009 domain-containing protein [Bacteroidales bacterium]|nr:DUF5009 domain-containing protein [Bacteroidales bacterium]
MKTDERLLSLDFFRGLTMFLLIAEFAHIFPYLVVPEFEGNLIYGLGQQLHHCEWEGLHFWDLIQPFFMFIVGVAMPLSFAKRSAKGDSRSSIISHVLKRSALLLLLGWALYCIDPGKIVFRFQNVLAQLSVTYLLAFLVMKKPVWFQISFSIALLILTEALYRFFSVGGFDQPFVAGHNFGAWVNLQISGETGAGNWAMFNAIPTTAHTIWGVLAGQLLMSSRSGKQKLLRLIAFGLAALVLGYALSPLTPIIKRISTSTFVLVSGGWTLLVLAFSYWLIDILKYRKMVLFFSVVGMNPLFIYLFAHVGGAALIRKVIYPFSQGLFSWTSSWTADFITGLLTLSVLWFICYWLYKRRIFFRI